MRIFTELSNSIFYSKRFIKKKKKKQSDNSLATFRSALLSPTLLKHGARGQRRLFTAAPAVIAVAAGMADGPPSAQRL